MTYADVVDFVIKLLQVVGMLTHVVDDVRRQKEMNEFRRKATGEVSNAHRVDSCAQNDI